MIPRRAVQAACLGLFLALLGWSYVSGASWAAELFPSLDPLGAVLTALAVGGLSLAILPGLAVLVSSLVLGRAFCSWVCPLGTTLDMSDFVVRRGAAKKRRASRPWAMGVLVFVLGASLLGVSLAFLAAPLSLSTRFYGLVAAPLIAWGADAVLHLSAPVLKGAGLRSLAFAEIPVKVFAAQWFIVVFIAVLAALGRSAPRFWCRNLCPAGALLGLGSIRPLVRRRVSGACTGCGACARACPMGAIDPKAPADTARSLCIECSRCADVCPEKAVGFLPGPEAGDVRGFSPSRRALVASAVAGAGAALVLLPGESEARAVLRPPGAPGERDFLAACVRCGACMAVCPTNTLQPLYFASGAAGLFSPSQHYGVGPCDPTCRRCAQACPTGALRLAATEDRLFAKLGTAKIVKDKCLAWKKVKSCLVCDEVCPYDAVVFKHEPEHGPIMVPEVQADKCAGCGYCQKHCPAVEQGKAIVVEPVGALRPGEGSLEAAARAAGLKLAYKPKEQGGYAPPGPGQGPAPGFTD